MPVCTWVCWYWSERVSVRTYMGIWGQVGKDRAGAFVQFLALTSCATPLFLGWVSAFSPKLFLAVFVIHAKVGKLCVVGEIREGILCDSTDTYLLYHSPLLLALVFVSLHLRTGVICLGFEKGCVVVYMSWCVCACDMYLSPHACTVSKTYHMSSSDHGWKLVLPFFVKALSLESSINKLEKWMMVVRISGAT